MLKAAIAAAERAVQKRAVERGNFGVIATILPPLYVGISGPWPNFNMCAHFRSPCCRPDCRQLSKQPNPLLFAHLKSLPR